MEVIVMRRLKNQSKEGELLTIEQACSLCNLGRDTIRKLADASGAVRKIGKCYRIEKNTLLSYINETCAKS